MGSSALKLAFCVFALCALASAYSVSGDVFYFAERDMSTTLVKAYSGGALVGQAVCDKGGSYSLELPAGDYVITAQYYDQQDKSMLSSSENVTVLGNTRLDLILFPDFEDMPNFTSPEFPVEEEFEPAVAEQAAGPDIAVVAAALALIAVVVMAGYFLFVRKKEQETEIEVAEKPHKKMDEEEGAAQGAMQEEAKEKAKAPKPEYDDIEKVMAMVAKQRQISQGDIIKATNFSSAKVSLILKELERKKRITREKIGRMKIIRARRVK
jgi:uncharacterized membrane protein